MKFLSDIQLPNSWKEVTVEEFIELNSIDSKEFGFYGSQLERFCILAGIDSDDDRIEDIPIQELNKWLSKLHFLSQPPSYQIKETIDDFNLLPFTKLTLGAWIDLDEFIKEPIKNISKIFAILYRKKKEDEWGNIFWEPYIYDLNSRAEEFESHYIYNVYAAYTEFIKFREKVIEKYRFLFDTDEEGDLTDEEKEGLSNEDVQDINEYLKKLEVKKKFAWQDLAYKMAGEDITKMKDVLNTPIIMVFNILAMNKVMSE